MTARESFLIVIEENIRQKDILLDNIENFTNKIIQHTDRIEKASNCLSSNLQQAFSGKMCIEDRRK